MPLLMNVCRPQACVEPGVPDGDGIAVARYYGFPRIYSCDIDPAAIDKAKSRFPQNNVLLRLGDSRQFISEMAASLEGPSLFWLDAHFPDHAAREVGEFPLPDALQTLSRRQAIAKDVVVCDDMRCI